MMADQQALAYPLLKVAQQKFALPPSQLNDDQRRQAFEIIKRQQRIEDAILQSLEAVDVAITQEQVNAAIADIRSRLGDDDKLNDALGEVGLDSQALMLAVERELRVDAVLDKVCCTLEPVNETDARIYYYMNPDRFVRPEIRVARHILITINPDFPENERETALRRSWEICHRLQKKPERFAEQAIKHSECPSALQGGLMGNVPRGTLFPELESVLFGMKVGQVSDVVESPLGFHVLMCDSIHAAAPLGLEDILPQLRDKLEQQQRDRVQRRWISDLLRLTDTPSTGRFANG